MPTHKSQCNLLRNWKEVSFNFGLARKAIRSAWIDVIIEDLCSEGSTPSLRMKVSPQALQILPPSF